VGDIFSFIMEPLYYLISVVLVGWHSLLSPVFGADSGVTWALSIIGLTLVVRAALIPLFVKQIKSSRNMQLLQPRVKELQKKYGHDRERLAQETMSLYRETKTNPFASCLPLIVQIPIFIALFRLLDIAAKKGQGHGVLTDELARSFADAPIFGGTLSDSFINDGGSTSIKVVAAVLVVIMVSTTFLTQRQLMSKNMPADALTGPYAQQQKLLLYILPFTFVLSGPFFPIGVIMYWTTSNLWTMGQQFYVIRNNPAPNTEAARAKEQRDEQKRKHKGLPAVDPAGAPVEPVTEPERPAQRQQPKKQSRSQRKKGSGGGAGKPGGQADGQSGGQAGGQADGQPDGSSDSPTDGPVQQ
jgi:YidC/Oxa1 family membrane protein insertase